MGISEEEGAMAGTAQEGIVKAASLIQARPERVYGILADYHKDHPGILPRKYFRKLEVLEGGKGAGTKTRLEMSVLGSRRTLYHVISEPEPGRVLVESDLSGSSVTTFTVEPRDGGAATLLTIETAFIPRPGFLGGLERRLTSMMLRRIYAEELGLLASYASGKMDIPA